MANQEDSEIDVEIRSLVCQLRELHEKLEEEILKLMKVVEECSRTSGERERLKVLIEMLIKDREEVRELLEDHAVFVNSRNKSNSLDMKTSRMDFLKERVQKFKNLDQGIQESGDHFRDQDEQEDSYSSGYVADVEMEPKDPIFSLDDSDTSSEEAIEVWNGKNVDSDIKRKFLEKAMGSSCEMEMEIGIEIEIAEFIDTSDDKNFSTNIKELWEQRDLFIDETSGDESSEDIKDGGNDADMEYSPDHLHVLSNIEGLVKDIKEQDEAGNWKSLEQRKKEIPVKRLT